ncbi:MAG: MBL fold metallo-hydrolase RNA specificity domain-containing protein, partial [Planctomycetaceae bacterium]
GNRDHPPRIEMDDVLCGVLEHAARDGGTVLIPAFAVGRAQEILYHLRTLSDERSLAFPQVYLDSPLAIRAAAIVRAHRECLDERALERLEAERGLFSMPQLHVVRDRDHSRRLNEGDEPKIIVAASGMCTGGPILHHLRHHLWRENTHVIFVGFQGERTLGRKILDGAKKVRIHGRLIAVKARVHFVPGLSAHADRSGLIAWGRSAGTPRTTFLNHGEPEALEALAGLLKKELGHAPVVPRRGEAFALG